MVGLNSEFLPRAELEALGFASLGDDVLVHRTAVIVDCAKLHIGSRVRIDPYVIISNLGGVRFGNNIHVGAHTVMAGSGAVEIGDFANISHHIGIFTSNQDFSGRVLSHPTVKGLAPNVRTADIHLGRHCAVGVGSVVLAGARLEEGTVLGAMSRVGRPLKAWTTYAGVPAKRLGERRRDLLAQEQEYLAMLAAKTN